MKMSLFILTFLKKSFEILILNYRTKTSESLHITLKYLTDSEIKMR